MFAFMDVAILVNLQLKQMKISTNVFFNPVHYGHSCLIPVDQTSDLKKLYVFVDIKMDSLHFVNNIKAHIKPGIFAFNDLSRTYTM